jgi:hypothetical protein
MGAVPQAQRKRLRAATEGRRRRAGGLAPRPRACWCRSMPPTWSCRTALAYRCAAALSSRSSALAPPVPRTRRSTSAALAPQCRPGRDRRDPAAGTGELLYIVREQPLVTLRSGGVGVREMLKRLGETGCTSRCTTPPPCSGWSCAPWPGLIRLDVDSSVLAPAGAAGMARPFRGRSSGSGSSMPGSPASARRPS